MLAPDTMKKALGLVLVVALSLGWAPDPTEAGGRRAHGRGPGPGGFRGGGPHHHPPRHHHRPHHRGRHRAFPHRPFFPAFVAPSAVVSTGIFVAPAPVYSPPPVYAPAPAYSPPVAYPAPPLPPPVPRVVEYPGGRYELRGDGVTTPYVWVWIPDPPVAPPPPPAPPAEGLEPSRAPRSPAPRTTAYRWTDDNGVTTWTDSLEKVPPRFRAEASRSAVTP
jgi:hypothetical protein